MNMLSCVSSNHHGKQKELLNIRMGFTHQWPPTTPRCCLIPTQKAPIANFCPQLRVLVITLEIIALLMRFETLQEARMSAGFPAALPSS